MPPDFMVCGNEWVFTTLDETNANGGGGRQQFSFGDGQPLRLLKSGK